MREGPANHRQDLLDRLTDEDIPYRLLVAQQDCCGLGAEGIVSDDGAGGGGWGGTRYTRFVHKRSPYGPRPGRVPPRRDFFYSVAPNYRSILKNNCLIH